MFARCIHSKQNQMQHFLIEKKKKKKNAARKSMKFNFIGKWLSMQPSVIFLSPKS